MDINRLLADLGELDKITEARLHEAVAEAAHLVPSIAARLDAASDGAFPLPNDARIILVGLHVLAAARRTEVLPAFMRFLRRAAPASGHMFGFGIAEDVADIAISLFDGDPEPLVATIEDPETDPFVCWGLFRVLTQLVIDGRIARGTMLGLLDRFDRRPPEGLDIAAWEGWRGAILSLGLKEYADRLLATLRDDRGPGREPDVRDWEERTERLRRDALLPDDLDRERPKPIDDVAAVLLGTHQDAFPAGESGEEPDVADNDAADGDDDPAAGLAVSEAELDWLESFIAVLPPGNPRPPLGWIDGFYTALAAGPVPLTEGGAVTGVIGEPSADAPAGVAAGVAAARAFADQLLIRHFEAIKLRLAAKTSTLPLQEVGDERPYQNWAEGFLYLVEGLGEQWQPLYEKDGGFADVLKMIVYAATGDTSRYRTAPPEEVDEIAVEIDATVSLIYDYWQDAAAGRQRIVPVRTAPKIGRNQPCPCGSGKKYKKCCGKAA